MTSLGPIWLARLFKRALLRLQWLILHYNLWCAGGSAAAHSPPHLLEWSITSAPTPRFLHRMMDGRKKAWKQTRLCVWYNPLLHHLSLSEVMSSAISRPSGLQLLWISQSPPWDMVLPEKTSRPSAAKKVPKQRPMQHQSLPSPALCCACGLCIMLAGINITLVGAFAFGTFIPTGNPPIIIGPLLLLVALAFFTACCVVSRRPPAHIARKAKGGEKWGLMRMGVAAFEMETSEHTLQDTTAVQLSPTNSPSSSHKSSSSHGSDAAPADCQEGASELISE